MAELVVNGQQLLSSVVIKVRMPRALGLRMWIAGRLFGLAAWVSGTSVVIGLDAGGDDGSRQS